MNTGHLFAGAGGGIYADLILGHTPIFAVEWDDDAADVLRSRIFDSPENIITNHHLDETMTC